MTKEYFKQVTAMLITAFSLVAALAWNEAVKALIERYFQAGGTIWSKFAYALIITGLVVLITIQFGKIAKKLKL